VEPRHADVRILAATHRDLKSRVAEGRFREDLYFRLNVFPIRVPSLRERPEDLPALIEDIARQGRASGRAAPDFSAGALDRLRGYDWPGNVRELANLIERLVVIKPNGGVKARDLPWPIVDREDPQTDTTEVLSSRLSPAPGGLRVSLPRNGLDLKQYLAKIEQDMIHQALVESDGVVQRAAELLGVGRTTLVEKIRRFDITH